MKQTLQSHGWEAKDSQAILLTLSDLAPFGAKQRNFRKRYVTPKDGWKKLPRDPNDIPYGHWY
ncbi:hypothetical protein [Flocculibacter collagenilyticus]|uniref:hypothetical protein n=1 Tax=Flocculibacter collagenilyticus TaxID=2744479 RepID=UPI0018F579AA|nr:hypothetical protein [Flocculibacter collagenilyticus]